MNLFSDLRCRGEITRSHDKENDHMKKKKQFILDLLSSNPHIILWSNSSLSQLFFLNSGSQAPVNWEFCTFNRLCVANVSVYLSLRNSIQKHGHMHAVRNRYRQRDKIEMRWKIGISSWLRLPKINISYTNSLIRWFFFFSTQRTAEC